MAKSTGRNVGSVNLRGKRSLALYCRCCWAYDLRPKFLAKEAAREIREDRP